ncbi:MAG: EAL domain-containing protein [Peptococcaceae bacterium]|jgi:polar amino acid transport system substrate-binding protein|nr:EAL domain-containing protein [Peptococcaceae bacterium]
MNNAESQNQKRFDPVPDAYLYGRFRRDEQGNSVDCDILEVNLGFETLCGLAKSVLLKQSLREIWPSAAIRDSIDLPDLLHQCASSGQSMITERYSDDQIRCYRIHLDPQADDGFAVHIQDISETKYLDAELIQRYRDIDHLQHLTDELKKRLSSSDQLRHASKNILELSDRRFKVMVNHFDAIAYTCNLDGAITAANKKFCDGVQTSEEDLIGRSITRFLYVEPLTTIWENALAGVIRTQQTQWGEYTYKDAQSETIRHYQLNLTPILDAEQNTIIGVCGLNLDITDFKQKENRMTRLAYYDSLTQLPNKTLFTDRLNRAISTSKRTHSITAVAFIDIDDFKKFNDTYGYEFGNQLLVHVGHTLQRCIRECDTVARSSEDKFLLLLQDVRHINELFPILDRIKSLIHKPHRIAEQEICPTLSMGISVYPNDGLSSEEILINAEIAMYKAKDLGKDIQHFFNYNIKQIIIRKTQLEATLKHAMQNNEFILYYQSQYEAHTRRLRGFETLIRWNNPQMGLVLPSEFLPVAEEYGLILDIGRWVIEHACQKIHEIISVYQYNPILAVNISEKQLLHPDFISIVTDAVQQAEIPAHCLELEISESIVDNHFQQILDVLKSLDSIGVRIAIDKFGSGKLSFNHLLELPIRLVKMDKSFFDETNTSDPRNLMTEPIISFAHKINIELLAEGVETQEQIDHLIREHCDHIQGYFFEEPVPEEGLAEIITKGIQEKKALTRKSHKAGLTYEGLLKQRKQQVGGYWDEKQ